MPTEEAMQALLNDQKIYFRTGKTRSVEARIQALNRLEQAITAHEEDLYLALQADLGKSRTESFLCEVGLTLSELRYVRAHLRRWSRRRTVPSSLPQFPGKCWTAPEPYGVVLILSPWNYPVLLTLEPLIGALAAGNCAIVKPSAYSPHTSALLAKLLEEAFPSQYVAVVLGGRQENQGLLSLRFDYIFFTGSAAVGRDVMAKAAAHLTPVTLELGGKSPCIVDETANLTVAARRIIFGKLLNCGQTCVAPDYILVHASRKHALLQQLSQEITHLYGHSPLKNPGYGNIVNEKHFRRLLNLLEGEAPFCGGESDPASLRIAPTILDQVSPDSPMMQEEIFGPLLPVLSVESLDEAISFVQDRPKPLALYLFTADRAVEHRVLTELSFGGGCVNDTILHLASSRLPFGGVGNSGMGAYHGKKSFQTFSHEKSILKTPTGLDLSLRYPPYTSKKEKWLKWLLK